MQTYVYTFLITLLGVMSYVVPIFLVYFFISNILKLQKAVAHLNRQIDELQRIILDQNFKSL